MANEENKFAIALPGEWALQKVLGPTLAEIGEDLKKIYAAGRDRIVTVAIRKSNHIDDGQSSNLRVTRDIFWNGAFTDDEVCAEYFGGLLAASRSPDGMDDSAIPFVDAIKALSSSQLHLHYATYNSLNKILVKKDSDLNVGSGSELRQFKVWLASSELATRLNININTDFTILYRQGLIGEWKTEYVLRKQKGLYCTSVTPTTFGIMLYAIAHNRLHAWGTITSETFGDFGAIPLPVAFADSQEALFAQDGSAPWMR